MLMLSGEGPLLRCRCGCRGPRRSGAPFVGSYGVTPISLDRERDDRGRRAVAPAVDGQASHARWRRWPGCWDPMNVASTIVPVFWPSTAREAAGGAGDRQVDDGDVPSRSIDDLRAADRPRHSRSCV